MTFSIYSQLPLSRQLTISAVAGIGMSFLASRISNTALSWAASSAILVNQLWIQTITSKMVPKNNRAISFAAHPITLLAARSLSWISGASYWALPTRVATVFVVGQNALNKGDLMDVIGAASVAFSAGINYVSSIYEWVTRKDIDLSPLQELEKIQAEMINLQTELTKAELNKMESPERYEQLKKQVEDLGTKCRALNIKNKQHFHSPLFFCQPDSKLAEKIRENTESARKEIDDINKKYNEDTKKIKQSIKEIQEQSQEEIKQSQERVKQLENERNAWEANYQREKLEAEKKRKANYAAYGKPGCPAIEPMDYEKLSHLDRAAHKNLNALCEEHAKVIIALPEQKFENDTFDASNGCLYLKNLCRNVQLTLHPDKNRGLIDLAKKAFIEANAAAHTLAQLHNPPCLFIK